MLVHVNAGKGLSLASCPVGPSQYFDWSDSVLTFLPQARDDVRLGASIPLKLRQNVIISPGVLQTVLHQLFEYLRTQEIVAPTV